jgi:hypothetical protein
MFRVFGRMTKRKFVPMFILEMIALDHGAINIKFLKFIFGQRKGWDSSFKSFKA